MKKHILILFTGFLAFACGEEQKPDIDTEYPEIIVAEESFPRQCSVLKRGSTVAFKALFKDNKELGGFSLDIHHNFDHHTHSTELGNCDTDPVKAADNPMLFIQTYSIPSGLTVYEGTAEVQIPTDVDPGDYHFMIRLTDREGWQTVQGLSIKIQ